MHSSRLPRRWRDGGEWDRTGSRVAGTAGWLLGFLLLPLGVLGQHDPQGVPVAAAAGWTADSLVQRPYRSDRVGRIDLAEGVRRARYRIARTVPAQVSPAASAKAYLLQARDEYGLSADLADLVEIDVKRSPGGTHVTLQQTLRGLPVFEHLIKVSLDARGQPSMAISAYSPRLRALEASFQAYPQIASREVADRLRRLLGDANAAVGEPTLVVYADKAPRVAWKTVVWPSSGTHEWLVLLDATSGAILVRRDEATHAAPSPVEASFTPAGPLRPGPDASLPRPAVPAATMVEGSGYAFLPDPLTTAGVAYGGGYIDADDADRDELNAQRKVVVLREISRGTDGLHRLEGPYVRITNQQTPGKPQVTFQPPAEADANGFFYTRSDDRFEAVNAYYHVDTSQRYVQGLGFLDVQNAPIPLNPHGHATEDNSQYFPALNYLSFGDGGIDDAEDADVIWHEYGHALLEGASPGLRSTVEGQSVHEAWADYWAASRRRSLFEEGAVPQAGTWRRLFPWDGNNTATTPPWLGRTINATGLFPGVQFDLYTPGVHWATTVMEVYDVVGRTITDRLHLQANYYLSSPVTYRDLAEALIRADVDLYDGQHASLLIDVLGRRGYVDPADYGPVVAHTPLNDTESLGIDVEFEVTVESLLYPITSVEVVVHRAGQAAIAVPAIARSQNRYTATLRLPETPARLYYHIRAQDASGRVTLLPSTAPLIEYTFQVGPDVEPPVISAWPITSASLLGWPVTVDVTVTDNLGVDSVWVEYRLVRGAAEDLIEEGSFALTASGGRFLGVFPTAVERVQEGDIMAYRVLARDVATVPNVVTWPADPEAWHRFEIGRPSIVFDFEGSVGGLQASGDWAQGAPTFGVHFAHSGSHVWATAPDGEYASTASVSTLQMPPVNLSAYEEAFLVFHHWYDFESDGTVSPDGTPGGILYDGGNVKVSTDGGATWSLVEPDGGYPGSISAMFGNPMGGERAFGGYSYGWRPAVLAIPVGSDVRIRFDAGADDGNSEVSIAYAGWVIDDVAFVARRPTDETSPVLLEGPPVLAELAASAQADNPIVTLRLSDDFGLQSVFAEYEGVAGGRTVSGRARLAMSGTDRERFEGILPVRGRDGFSPGDWIRFTVLATDAVGNALRVEAGPGEPFKIRYYLGNQVDLMADARPSGSWHRSAGTWSVGKGDAPQSGLVLRRYDLPSNAETIQLVLRHAYRLGQGAGGNLKVSADDGSTWTTVTPVSGYPGRLADALPGLGSEDGFSSGITSGVLESRFDLAAYAGRPVQVRVNFAASESMADNEFWRIEAVRLDIRTSTSDAFETPREAALHANFPNPFSETTSISYTLEEEGSVRLEVFDVLGRRAALIFEGEQDAGTYSYVLNGTALPAGMYLLRLQAGDRQWVRTVVRVRG